MIVAAGSLVPPGKRLERGFLYKGNPVSKARALTEKERQFFAYTAQNYVGLKNQYMNEPGIGLTTQSGKSDDKH